MKNIFLFIAIIFSNSALYAEEKWLPPLDPHVYKILEQAEIDQSEGMFELALNKYAWFHEKGKYLHFKTKRAWLSHGYGQWYLLSNLYEPALIKLKDARDSLENKIKNDSEYFQEFYDFSIINEYFKEYIRIVQLFKWLDINNPDMAEDAYRRAETELIYAGEYKLCNKYINPKKDLKGFIRVFNNSSLFLPDSGNLEKQTQYSIDKFTNEVAVLVALLSINNRIEESQSIKNESLSIFDEPKFRDMLDEALKGEFPEEFYIYNR